MANISCAYVRIYGEGCGAELKAYIAAAQKNAFYNIIDYNDGCEIDEKNKLTNSGIANGRWDYESNLRGYFDDAKRKSWCGGHGESEWAALVEKLKSGARVEINYEETEPGCNFVACGGAVIEWNDGFEFKHDVDSYEYSIENIMKVMGFSRGEAIDYVCGWCNETDCEYCGGESK